MKNNLVIFVLALFLLPLAGCNNGENIDNPQDITMPTEITQMQEQYGNFDPNTVIETLKNTPIWIEEVLVHCISKDGVLIEANLVFDKDRGYMDGASRSSFVFSDNNIREFNDVGLSTGYIKLIYRDYPMQYDPDTGIISTTVVWPDESTHQYETKVLAMTGDRIMLEGSIGPSFITYRDGIEFSYPNTFCREILRAGTQEDLDRWKDAVDASEYYNGLNGTDSE